MNRLIVLALGLICSCSLIAQKPFPEMPSDTVSCICKSEDGNSSEPSFFFVQSDSMETEYGYYYPFGFKFPNDNDNDNDMTLYGFIRLKGDSLLYLRNVKHREILKKFIPQLKTPFLPNYGDYLSEQLFLILSKNFYPRYIHHVDMIDSYFILMNHYEKYSYGEFFLYKLVRTNLPDYYSDYYSNLIQPYRIITDLVVEKSKGFIELKYTIEGRGFSCQYYN
tara:strand:+ start:780 stop:1445 length:666 start_codon:yes stop_codon:yes gene_type:complete